MTEMSPGEQAVRGFFACYSTARPDDFVQYVSDDYTDYGHTPPGRGPQGARDDLAHAIQQNGGTTTYAIDALVDDGDAIAAVWTGTLPDGSTARGVSLYRIHDGRIRSTRHARLAS